LDEPACCSSEQVVLLMSRLVLCQQWDMASTA
jgi:hypothetical protein